MAKMKKPRPVEAVFETDVHITQFETRGYKYGRIYVSVPAEYAGRKAHVIIIIYGK